MSGIDLFRQGGFIMYPLMIFSILAWSVGIYKAIQLWRFSRECRRVNLQIKHSITSNKNHEISSSLIGVSPLVSDPMEVLSTQMSKELMYERMSRKLAQTNSCLKQNLWILGSISASAPFIGLFGTVVGIMESFKAIGLSGKSGFSVVAAGISESLVATAAGIIVAVVALLFYNFLQSRVNSIAQEFRLMMEEHVDLLTTPSQKAG